MKKIHFSIIYKTINNDDSQYNVTTTRPTSIANKTTTRPIL
jgi:hypothetical protein